MRSYRGRCIAALTLALALQFESVTAIAALDLTVGAPGTNAPAKLSAPRPASTPHAARVNSEAITGLSPEVYQAEYPWHQALEPVFVAITAAQTIGIPRGGEAFFGECIQLTKSRSLGESLLVAAYGPPPSAEADFRNEMERLRRAAIKSDIRVARRATRIDPETGASRLDPPAFNYSRLDLDKFLPLYLGDSARVRTVLSDELAEHASELSMSQLKAILHALCSSSFDAYREFRATGTGARAYRWSTWDTQLLTLAMADSRAAQLLLSRWVLEKCIQSEFSPHLHIACYNYLIQHAGPDFNLIPGDNSEKIATLLLSRFYESARGLEIYMNREDIFTANKQSIETFLKAIAENRTVEAMYLKTALHRGITNKPGEDLGLYLHLVLSQCNFLRVNTAMLGEHHLGLIDRNARTTSALMRWLSVQILRGP